MIERFEDLSKDTLEICEYKDCTTFARVNDTEKNKVYCFEHMLKIEDEEEEPTAEDMRDAEGDLRYHEGKEEGRDYERGNW